MNADWRGSDNKSIEANCAVSVADAIGAMLIRVCVRLSAIVLTSLRYSK